MSSIRTAVVEGSPVYKLALAIALAFTAIAMTTAFLMSIGVAAPSSGEETAVVDILAAVLR